MEAVDRDLEEYRPGTDGPWGPAEAAHLARRASFGQPPALVRRILELGPRRAVDELFSDSEPGEGIELLEDTAMRVGDLEAVRGWWLYRMLLGDRPALEKLALFWHGHFATSNRKVENPRLMMRQVRLFQERGTGAFEDLLLDVARDPAMLIWLDSNTNRRGHPNENFAREIMELFSLGIGNYTETDIKEAARAFTGWHVRRDAFWFNRNAHDPGRKTVLGQEGPLGGEDIVSLCARHPSCARFVASKLFEFYVAPRPAEPLRDRLGALFTACGRKAGAYLRRLLSSRVFYAPESRRTLVASPIDYTIGSLATVEGRGNLFAVAEHAERMGQSLLEPPTVKGWDGGEAWLHSTSLLARYRFAAELTSGDGALEARVPWDEIEGLGVEGIPRRFFPGGLEEEIEQDLLRAASEAEDGGRGGTGEPDTKLLVAGCLQLPEYQYV